MKSIPTQDNQGGASAAIAAEEKQQLALPGLETEEAEVRKLHAEWLGYRRQSLETAIRLGKFLAELKAALKKAFPKRSWEAYVLDHLGIEPRTARNYMRIHRRASSIESIGTLLKSKTVSEIGIREMLDYLAEIDRAAKAGLKSSEAGVRAGSPAPASPAKGAREQTALTLADDSHLDLRSVKWVDGLIPLSSIKTWMERSGPDSSGPKLAARQQRAVIQLAATINHACRKARKDAATEVVLSAIGVVQNLLEEAATR